jgi:hypothetical protein
MAEEREIPFREFWARCRRHESAKWEGRPVKQLAQRVLGLAGTVALILIVGIPVSWAAVGWLVAIWLLLLIIGMIRGERTVRPEE